MLGWKSKKSAGIRVKPQVYRLIQQGDAARAAGRWTDAVAGYRAALNLDPDLPHVQMQLGHALKEANRFEEADAAYAKAARMRPDDHDAALHRAHLTKRFDRTAAAGHFAAILLRQGDHAEARDELRELLDSYFDQLSADQLQVVVDYAAAAQKPAPAPPPRADTRPLIFDLTDMIGHFRNQRLPTGIQRVQIEVLAAFLDRRGEDTIAACCFISGRDGWMEVPLAACRELIHLASSGGDVSDPAWQTARTRLFVHLALAEPYALPCQGVLVNLGSSLWVYDYFRFIRNAKTERQISYIPLVHDMIPVMKPETCVPGILADFPIWLVGLFQHADAFLANSQSTKRDLLMVAERLGHRVPDERVEVVPLDADFRRPTEDLPAAALERWGLAGRPFALLVATIEPRKNHGLAFDAWAALLRRHGADAVPQLVCVGRDGWMNDAVYDRLDTDPVLAAHVTVIAKATDAELALLYRECRFTLFPSLYEGWGLPVTESLCHGRVAVVADNSALPEAGGGFALPFASDSVRDLVRAVEIAAFDDAWRAAREAKIAAGYRPRSWAWIADQIEAAPARLLANAPVEAATPVAEMGLYYPVTLHQASGLWPGLASGEIFRIGDGWAWPDAGGCRTAPEGGLLRMRIAGRNEGRVRLYLRLRGLDSTDCPVIATVDEAEVGSTIVRREKHGWMLCDLPADAAETLEIRVRGTMTEKVGLWAGGHRKDHELSVSVAGFFLCERDDAAANAAFVKARRGDLEAISAYRRPESRPERGIVGRKGID